MSPQEIVRFIESRRFPLNSETSLHEHIAAELLKVNVVFRREVFLTPTDRIDFVIGDDIGVEVKIKGGKRSIYRQIERYCESGQISQIVLVSSVPMGLPPVVAGKPAFVANLSKAWL